MNLSQRCSAANFLFMSACVPARAFRQAGVLFLCRSALLLCALTLLGLAHAANPADWWVDIANDRADKVRTMLVRGADPNALSPQGQPAIMQAVRDGAWNTYDVLVKSKKTDVEATNTTKETPLMYLALVGQTQRAADLIRRGAKVNRLGWTPLHYAASKGQLDMVNLLLMHKAIVNAPAPDGTTPLMMAAFSGSEPVVQALLNAGAEVTTQNLQKLDAADWARSKKYDSLAAKLDALTKKTLAQRRDLRAGVQPGVAAKNAGQAATGAESESSSNGDGSAAGKASSTSRYFDLERFEKSPSP
jgi:ankyrin repeat protein